MKLIKVQTHGFKSFADKIQLTFDGGIVGIVGPNGSGKSNINDAIKWVLGETSAKSLRGDSMEDVIFSGSKTVKGMDKAEVSLTFDNSEGRVAIPHKIFTITRRLKRGGGKNEYFINGEQARLKDIKTIAMESGISKSSLAIISQGTIQDIAQSTPEERRGIFEEAAGISKYKSRKKEALKKLERTTESLEKINTVVLELEKQLKPLQKQAEKAKIYLQKRDELKAVEVSLIVEDIKFFGAKLRDLNEELSTTLTAKEDLNDRITRSEQDLVLKNNQKLKLENEVSSLTEKLQTFADKLRNLEIVSASAAQRRQMIMEGQIKISSAGRLEVMKEELNELRAKIHQYNVWEQKFSTDVIAKQKSVSEIQTKTTELSMMIENQKRNKMKIETKLNLLQDYQENKSNLFQGTRVIVENKQLFKGFNGIVADLLVVDLQYRPAIQTVLANALQHVVVDQTDDAVKAVNFLKSNKSGRATFIPLNTISPKGIRQEHQMIVENSKGFVGIGSNLIQVKPKYEVLKKFLLGSVIVASSIEDATNISRLLEKRYMIVTLDGDIVRPGGILTGGEKAKSREMLGLDEQIEKLNQSIPLIANEITTKVSQMNELSSSIGEEQSVIGELQMEIVKINEKRSVSKTQFESLKSQYESETKEKLQFDQKADEIESVSSLEAEKASLQALLKAKRDSIASLNADLSSLTISKTELEKSLRQILETSSEKMTEKNQADYILTNARQRLTEEYEMTFENAKESAASLVMDREEAREFVAKLRGDIRDLGHVNVDSISAFEEVEKRHKDLSKAQTELFDAQQTILAAVSEMDQIIIKRLDDTVQLVNKKMSGIFQTMFGGGQAEVRYSDPTNLLETGIEVIAQPPGKTIKNLKLFSGGEKAIVAITLLFAILKSKPLPLCLLDEVEAALDDANVVRYADFLQELKNQTQFIVVTHRVGTMARVDHLFGATMQKRGVTSFYSVDMKEAKELIKDTEKIQKEEKSPE